MASNSGCTEVLVDGASTANLARQPRESVIPRFLTFFLRLDDVLRAEQQAERRRGERRQAAVQGERRLRMVVVERKEDEIAGPARELAEAGLRQLPVKLPGNAAVHARRRGGVSPAQRAPGERDAAL